MRKQLCPQCKIGVFYIKDNQGNRLTVYVDPCGKVVPKDPSATLDGYDLDEVFCMGCSWHGSPKRLVKY